MRAHHVVLFFGFAAIAAAQRSPSPAVRIGLSFGGGTRTDHHTGAEAPDAGGAVGPRHVVEFINGDFRVYEKATGKRVLALTSREFWGRADGSGGAEANPDNKDPRIFYDASAGRWYASSQRTAGKTDGSTPIVLARSDTADPIAGWKAVTFLVDPERTPDTFSDFDVLGYNADSIFISMNLFSVQDKRPRPLGTALFSIKKSDLNLPSPVLTLNRQQPVNDSRDFSPVLDYQGKSHVITFVARTANRSPAMFLRHDIGGDVKTWKLERTATPVELAKGVELQRERIVVMADQPGGKPISVASGIPTPAPFVNGEFWYIYMVALPDDPKRTGIRWIRVRASDNTIIETGLLRDPVVSPFNPSIAVDAKGHVVVGCHGVGPNQFLGGYAFTGRLEGGRVTFDPLMLVKAGEGAHTGDSRWGDFSVTVPDPTESGNFWLFQAYAQANGDWAMQISQLIFPNR